MGLYDVSMLITHFASIFISSLRILRLFVRASPSQSPQSSITMEWVRPILLGKKKKKKKNPSIHATLQFLVRPPAIALLEFPQADPSMLSLKKPIGGVSNR